MTAEKKIAEIRRKMIPGSKLNKEDPERSAFADQDEIESVRKKMFPRSKLLDPEARDEDVEKVRNQLFPLSKESKPAKSKTEQQAIIDKAMDIVKKYQEEEAK